MLGTTLCAALLAAAPTAPAATETVRLQASVVLASSDGREMAPALRPLESRLRTMFPYTSYRSFTEYTKVVAPGEALELWLPDGRKATLRPQQMEAGLAAQARPIRVTIEGGEELVSRAVCDHVTVLQVRGTGPHHGNGGRVFLVFAETCPGEHPRRLLEPGK